MEGIRKTCLNANYFTAHVKSKIMQGGNIALGEKLLEFIVGSNGRGGVCKRNRI